MFRVILPLLCLTMARYSLAFPNKIASQMHCIFSSHLLYFFELNERLFKIENADKDVKELTVENVEQYGKTLQTRGDIVMAMLDELQRKKRGRYAADLVLVNLYLNNIVGNVNPYDSTDGQVQFTAIALRKGYVKVYKTMTKTLRKSTKALCGGKVSKENAGIEFLSPKKFKIKNVNDPNEIRSKMQQMLDTANEVLSLSIQISTHLDFHPENMLMCDLISGGQSAFESRLKNLAFPKSYTADSATSSVDDGLQAIRQVKFNANKNMKTDHGIVDLFHAVKFNLNAFNVKSYQQQALVATVYPVFKCIKSYLDAFKQIYYTYQYSNFGLLINMYGLQLNYVIRKFRDLYIFPYKVITYINTVQEKLKAITDYTKGDRLENWSEHTLRQTHPKWIPKLLSLCSSPMLLNNIKFDSTDTFMESITDTECNSIIIRIKTELDSIQKYVSNLEKNRSIFHVVIKNVPHDDIFTKKPLDVFKPCQVVGFFKICYDDEGYETALCTSCSLEDNYISTEETFEN